jgi:hypothetical protein
MGFLNRRPQVRVLSGPPVRFVTRNNKDLAPRFAQRTGMLCKPCRRFVLAADPSWRPHGAAANVVAAIVTDPKVESAP